jgi:hypothetical protein
MLTIPAYSIPQTLPLVGRGLYGRDSRAAHPVANQVRKALTAAIGAELMHVWPTGRASALLNNISSRPGSMWLDAVPYAPALRLDVQSYQDEGRVRMGVRTFFSLARAGRTPAAIPSRTTTSRMP